MGVPGTKRYRYRSGRDRKSLAPKNSTRPLQIRPDPLATKFKKTASFGSSIPRRREYPMGIVCDPTDKVNGLYFNTWQGLAIAPSESDPKFLVDHIETNRQFR